MVPDKHVLKSQLLTVTKALEATKEQYGVVSNHGMFGLHIMLIAKKAVMHRMTEISTSQCVKKGNRGAVAARFRFADTTFCFINCALESGIGKDFA